MINKNLGKFEVKILNTHNLANTKLIDVEQATSMYIEFKDVLTDNTIHMNI